MLTITSDFEMSQGFTLFKSMIQADPKCHEAMFGLGRINYIQGRYENAEKWLIKAYETKRDFTYRVWLGFTQVQLYKICTADNPKKLRFAQNAVANLDRCRLEPNVGLYANFGLLDLAFKLTQIKGLQEPMVYAMTIKQQFSPTKSEGILALAIVNLRSGEVHQGVKSLLELTQLDAGLTRSLAHFCLVRHYLGTKDYQASQSNVEEAMSKLANMESFQER